MTSQEDLRARLDRVLARAAIDAETPGAQAALMQRGQLIWTGTHGLARTDPPAAVQDCTLFYVASLGKLILSAVTLHLVAQKRLELDLPVSHYVADEVPGAEVVTVRMLLSHTAGYPDLYAAPAISGILQDLRRSHHTARGDAQGALSWAVIKDCLGQPTESGTRWEYSNTGYIVLAYILSRLAGGDHSFRHTCMPFIYSAGSPEPMTGADITMNRSRRATRLIAHGHTKQACGPTTLTHSTFRGNKLPADLYGPPFGDGLFAGTARGTAQFLDALFARQALVPRVLVREMTCATGQALQAGEHYGLGTERFVTAGRVWHGHRGNYGGFTSLGATDLDRGTTLVTVANCTAPSNPAAQVWETLVTALDRRNAPL